MSYLQAVAAATDSLSEATQFYLQIKSSEIDAIVPRNEVVCNQPGKSTVDEADMFKSTTRIQFNIQLPEQACRLMAPALTASGRWGLGFSSNILIYAEDCHYFSKGNTLTYNRTKLSR